MSPLSLFVESISSIFSFSSLKIVFLFPLNFSSFPLSFLHMLPCLKILNNCPLSARFAAELSGDLTLDGISVSQWVPFQLSPRVLKVLTEIPSVSFTFSLSSSFLSFYTFSFFSFLFSVFIFFIFFIFISAAFINFSHFQPACKFGLLTFFNSTTFFR